MNTKFEEKFSSDLFIEDNKYHTDINIVGFVDAIDYDNKIVWEFKCTENLDE